MNDLINFVRCHQGRLKKFADGNDSDVFVFSKNGKKYVLKAYLIFTQKEVLREIIAMNYLKRFGFPTPAPKELRNKKYHFFYKGKPAIIYPYIPGEIADNNRLTPKMFKEAGGMSAKIDKKLKNLKIPGLERKKNIWDLMQFYKTKNLIKYLPARHKKLIPGIKKIFSGYKNKRTAVLKFRKQIILNDVSETNVLIKRGRVAGIVDFSDMVYVPTICSLAVSASHLCFNDGSWKKNLRNLVSGYLKYNIITREQLLMLPIFIRARVVTLILGNCYQLKTRNKLKKEYKKTIEKNIKRLKLLNDISDKDILKYAL